MSAIGNSLPQPVPSNHKVIGIALVIIGIIAAVAALYMGFSPHLPQLQRFILAGALGFAAIAFIIAGVVTARKAPIEGSQIILRCETASTTPQSISLSHTNPKTNVKVPLFNASTCMNPKKQAATLNDPHLGLTGVSVGIPEDSFWPFFSSFMANLLNIKFEAYEEVIKKLYEDNEEAVKNEQFEKLDKLLENFFTQLKSEEELAKHFERAIQQFVESIRASEFEVSFCIMLGYKLGGTVKFITATAGKMKLHVLSKQKKWEMHSLSTSSPLSKQGGAVQIAIHPFEDAVRIVGATFEIDQSQLPSLNELRWEASTGFWEPHREESAACFVLDMVDPNTISRNAGSYGSVSAASSRGTGQHETTFSTGMGWRSLGVVMTETSEEILKMFWQHWNSFNGTNSKEIFQQRISTIEAAFCGSSHRPSFIFAQCFLSDGQVKLVTAQAGGAFDLLYRAKNEQEWSSIPLTSNDPLGSKKDAFTVQYHDFRKDGTIVIIPRNASEILKTIKSESINAKLAEQLEEQKIRASWLTFKI